MNRIANLEKVLAATRKAVEARDWNVAERLSERTRSAVLEAAMACDREALDRMRDRLAAFRSALTQHLDPVDPVQAALAVLIRADATLAAIAARMRPTALPASDDAAVRSAADRVLRFLAGKRTGATTGEIAAAAGIANGTTSRVLTDLKARGLVTSRDAGRFVVSRLTPRGEAAAGVRQQMSARKAIRRSASPDRPAMQPIINRSHVDAQPWSELSDSIHVDASGATGMHVTPKGAGLSALDGSRVPSVPATPVVRLRAMV